MKNPKPSPNNSSLGNYAYYTGVGFQMLAIIGVFTYIGYRIDKSRDAGSPIFTAVFALVGVCISIYTVIKSVLNRGK